MKTGMLEDWVYTNILYALTGRWMHHVHIEFLPRRRHGAMNRISHGSSLFLLLALYCDIATHQKRFR
mgnify:FL=1